MWKGKEKQVLVLPKEIEDKIEKSNDFTKVRRSIWRSAYDLFAGSDDFTDEDKREMMNGRAPYCHPNQRVEGFNKMQIHHKKPRRLFMNQQTANLLSNLIAVSPLMHEEGGMITDEYHYGEYHGKRKAKQREEKFDKSKRPRK